MLPATPSATVSPQPDPFFPLVRAAIQVPPRADWSALIFLAIVLAVSGMGADAAVALVMAMALRDLVRLATMKAMNAFDGRLLLFPFARGELPIGTSPLREAVILLCGPAFLVALSLVTWFAAKVTGPGLVLELSRVSVGLAAFTLLPLKPYDGWRLLNLALFSRSAKLEMAVSVLTSLLLAALSVSISAWFLTFFALINLATATRVLKLARAAEAVQQRGGVPGAATAELPDDALQVLYGATTSVFGDFAPGQELQARVCANTMREVHLHAARTVPSVGVSLVLLTVYGALIAYFLIGLVLLFSASAPASV